MNIINRRMRITASTIGVLLGLAALLNHGIFEVMQGNAKTNGPYIEAIGEAQRFWIHGTEGAFTVMPTFLAAGIGVIVFGAAMILWSVKFLDSQYGASVFLLLFILTTLSGGGIGYILLFLPTWGFSTRIRKPLNRWKRILPSALRKKLSGFWAVFLGIACLLWLTVMELGIFGYLPGVADPDMILNIVFILLFASVFFVTAAFVCAISRDLEEGDPVSGAAAPFRA